MAYQNYGYPARHVDADSFSPGNDLFMPGSRPKFMNFTILGGQTLLKGSVLGMVTASRKLKLAASAAGDGSQNPMAVLDRDLATFDTDGTTPLDMTFDVVVDGAVFNPAALVLGTGTTSNVAQDALRALGIQFRTPGFSG
jgi:hypothetical protein